MSDKTQVGRFLRNFKEKMKIFDVLFLQDRGKNINTLVILEITPAARRKALEALRVEDYSEGPLGQAMYGGGAEMWVFGVHLRKKEIYIKITMGIVGSPVICISFHIAEHTMQYPLREQASNSEGSIGHGRIEDLQN